MNPQEEVLIESARLGDIAGVKAALAAGARASNGAALYWAATQGHAEILSRLLAADANVHANNDATLRYAAASGHAEIVNLLLAADADVHAHDDEALRWAAVSGHVEIVSRLLVAGADIHANDDAALCRAARKGHAEVVNRLLAAGADPVVALKGALKGDRRRIATTLDACAAALTSAQRATLLAVSRPGELVRLRAIDVSAKKQRAIRR